MKTNIIMKDSFAPVFPAKLWKRKKEEVMIKRKELQKKSLAAVMAASMTMSLLPGTALADATSGVLADGTYESTAHVTRTAEDDEDENAWDEYDVNVKITVADGKFSDIAVTPGSGYNTENATYFKKAATNSKGFKTKLLGKDATIENIEGWDIVSGATRTSNAVKTAALAATQKATPTPEAVDTTALEKAIADAEALKEVDGTMFICADHGNAEQLIDYKTGEPFTAHTTNPVPFILVNYDEAYTLKEGGKLCDIVPTLIEIMGMEKPKEMTGESLLVKKNS